MVSSEQKPAVDKVIHKGNPILKGLFLDEQHFVGCGFDNAPLLFKHDGRAWSFVRSLDPGYGKKRAAKI